MISGVRKTVALRLDGSSLYPPKCRRKWYVRPHVQDSSEVRCRRLQVTMEMERVSMDMEMEMVTGGLPNMLRISGAQRRKPFRWLAFKHEMPAVTFDGRGPIDGGSRGVPRTPTWDSPGRWTFLQPHANGA